MSEEALVSVIIPTYRRAALVPRAIESVRRQSYGNLEILVVDDGSPDDTAAVVRAVPDFRIRYLRHECNKGLPAARNTGIQAARGEYIAFIDDDDEWRSDKVEKQVRALQKWDAVLCLGVAKGYPLRVHKRPWITLDDLRRGSFNPSGLMVKSRILKEIRFDENLRQGEDWDAFIRLAQRCSVGWVGEPLVEYNEAGHDRMTSFESLGSDEFSKRTAVLHKHREFFGEKWFNYHLADAWLAYIGRRGSKLRHIGYALRQCGPRAVVANLAHRVRRRIRRLIWTRA